MVIGSAVTRRRFSGGIATAVLTTCVPVNVKVCRETVPVTVPVLYRNSRVLGSLES